MSAALLVMSLAAVNAVAPELFLVEERDWRGVLPRAAPAGGDAPRPPATLSAPATTSWVGVFLEGAPPRRVAVLAWG